MGFFKPNVQKLKAQDNFHGLLLALAGRDQEIRVEAADAHGAMASPAAIDPLLRATEAGWGDVRVHSLRAIRPIVAKFTLAQAKSALGSGKDLLDNAVINELDTILSRSGFDRVLAELSRRPRAAANRSLGTWAQELTSLKAEAVGDRTDTGGYRSR